MDKGSTSARQMTARNRLALAAMLNGTMTGNLKMYLERPNQIRDVLLIQAEDWIALDPESKQFDQKGFLDWLRTAPLLDIVRQMDAMGRNPFSDVFNPGGVNLWDAYVESEKAHL